MIEALFQQLSPGCRSEVEAAMETAQPRDPDSSSPGDVSPACREEIQASARRVAGSMKGGQKVTSKGSSSSRTGDTTTQQQEEAAAAAAATAADAAKRSSQSILVVVAALVALFGAVIGYAFYVNANSSPVSQKKAVRKKVRCMLPQVSHITTHLF